MAKMVILFLIISLFFEPNLWASQYLINVFDEYYGVCNILYRRAFHHVWEVDTEYGKRFLVLRSATNNACERSHREKIRKYLSEKASFKIDVPASEDSYFKHSLQNSMIIRVNINWIAK